MSRNSKYENNRAYLSEFYNVVIIMKKVKLLLHHFVPTKGGLYHVGETKMEETG